MDEALIDTDILSEVLKAKDSRVLDRARLYLQEHGRFKFSAITFYEMMRGLRASQASRQLANFIALAATSDVLPVSMAVLDQAANLWADADLIIAATALQSGCTLVTGNVSHFKWISALKIDDWRR